MKLILVLVSTIVATSKDEMPCSDKANEFSLIR